VTDSGGDRPARTIFLGSGAFAVPTVEALSHDPRVNLLGIITAPVRPAAMQDIANDVPVAQWAHHRKMGTYRPPKLRDPAAIQGIRVGQPELLVLADYGQIVPPELLALPRLGAINLHPSLLPRHRGASPIPETIMAGDAETGVSLIKMDAGLDTGPIIAQRKHPLSRTESAPQLEATLAGLAADLLISNLGPWLAGEIEPQPQPEDGVTVTRLLRREDGRLDPALGIEHMDRQLRAYQPWPGTFIETPIGRVIVWDAQPLEAGASRHAGTLLRLPANRLALTAQDGMLELLEVQPAGGRRMSGAELLRGRPQLAGAVIGSVEDESEDPSTA
jgi:methionyl-tRNA formyltransferase